MVIETGTNFTSTEIDLSKGQYLFFKITLEDGITPIFSVDCKHEINILNVKASDPVEPEYTFKWGKQQSDIHDSDDNEDNYTLSMSFLHAPVTYHYLVELRDQNNNVIDTVKDVSFAGDDPADTDFTGLLIIRN